jgi:acetyl-CoA carboxylase biotin carboxylase subunit
MEFKKILIANRGEIAVRIIAACKELGIKTVAIYSEADKEAMHVQLADEAICIGPAEASKSYLNMPNIISAAEISGADAIHPGYGFLAENANFAEICETCHIKFIGPSPKVIRLMGDKAQARQIASEVNVPIIPGSKEIVANENEAKSIAKQIGYPIILKAAAGGGGKGMRIVNNEKELASAFRIAQTEAANAFGNSEIYIEKYFKEPRHIEVQVLGDNYGNYLHLFERECSIQRKHQKMVEEAPSPFLSAKLRRRITNAAVQIIEAVRYDSVGTIEFLVDADENFYFLEMNTRIQVEHPVTELITGIDILKQQILIAMDEKIALKQKDIEIRGHSIECRINAEDPDNFMPQAGKLGKVIFYGGLGIRIDTALYSYYTIPPYYDALIAKIIGYGFNREEARTRLIRSLQMSKIEGIKTNIPLQLSILTDEDFIKGNTTTKFIEQHLAKKAAQQAVEEVI